MSRSEENPYAAPASIDREPLDSDGASASVGPSVTSVSFRITLDDLRRGQPSVQYTIVMIIVLVVLLVPLGMSLRNLPNLFMIEWNVAIPLLLPAMVLTVVVVAVLINRWGKGSSESPFETTVTLTPTELVIRKEGMAELRRSWAGVGPIFLNKTTLRFDFGMYDLLQKRFLIQPGQIVPLRAFESEADASSFLATARQMIDSADRAGWPG